MLLGSATGFRYYNTANVSPARQAFREPCGQHAHAVYLTHLLPVFCPCPAQSTLTPGPIPVYVSNTSAVANVTGTVQLWQYLDANCRDTHTLIVNLTFTTAAGRPINGSKVYGYGMTGTQVSVPRYLAHTHTATLAASASVP